MGINCDAVYAGDNMNAAWVLENGKRLTLKIADVLLKVYGGDGEPEEKKLVLQFANLNKTLSLNVGNKNILKEEFGADTDGWLGKTIIVTTWKVAYAGKKVDGITLEIPGKDAGHSNGSHEPVQAMGELGEKRLTAALEKSSLDLAKLRAVLAQQPGKAAAAATEPATWPGAWMKDIAEWIKNPTEPKPVGTAYPTFDESDIPF
jgi:hypothetical protein